MKQQLMNAFGKIALIGETNYHPNTIRLFLYSLYGWVLCNVILLLPDHYHLWAPNGLMPVMSDSMTESWYDIFYLLRIESINGYYLLFIIGQMLSTALCLKNISWRFPRLLVLFFTYNVDNRAFLILNGGDNLIHLMLIYALFLECRENLAPIYGMSWIRQICYSLSNLAVYVARIQVCFVYLVAGLSKVTGEQWQNGTALFYTLNVEEYTLPMMSQLMTQYPFMSVVGSYGTLLFQLSFPWIVWFRQTRYIALALGTFLHLQISFVMGLLMFGFAMMVCYTIFTPESRSAVLCAWWARRLTRLPRQRELHVAHRSI